MRRSCSCNECISSDKTDFGYKQYLIRLLRTVNYIDIRFESTIITRGSLNGKELYLHQ